MVLHLLRFRSSGNEDVPHSVSCKCFFIKHTLAAQAADCTVHVRVRRKIENLHFDEGRLKSFIQRPSECLYFMTD